MLKFIGKRWAKTRYVFNQHVEAATSDLNAGLALRTAQDKRDLSARLTKEADEMDARIDKVSTMEVAGFYLCEDGHELGNCMCALPGDDAIVHVSGCSREPINGEIKCECGKPMKYIKRNRMTGQEKYESDKERGEAEKIAQQKREQAKTEEENAANGEKTAKYFQGLAESNRAVAEKIRAL